MTGMKTRIKNAAATLKEHLGQKKEEKGPARLPARHLRVLWKPDAKRLSLGGDRNKKIVYVEGGTVVREWPYSDAMLNALRDVRNLPVLDETGGSPNPQPDVIERMSPAKLDLPPR